MLYRGYLRLAASYYMNFARGREPGYWLIERDLQFRVYASTCMIYNKKQYYTQSVSLVETKLFLMFGVLC